MIEAKSFGRLSSSETDRTEAMTLIRPRTALQSMLAEIALAARAPIEARHRAVAEAIGGFCCKADLLEGRDCPCNPDRYVRHLLHADPEGGYAVVALVWRPGQMSPVHAHKTWCALGVHSGVLTESFYTPAEPPVLAQTRLLAAGDISHGPADPDLIHRLANLGCETAVSIHCYGVSFDRFGQDVNRIYAA